MPAESWLFVEKEKSPDMIHVLQFPYNGEPPRVCSSFPSILLVKSFRRWRDL